MLGTHETSFDEMSFDEMSLDETSFDETLFFSVVKQLDSVESLRNESVEQIFLN
jgi:hypothetical protein